MGFTTMFNVDGVGFVVRKHSVYLSRRAIHFIVVCGTTQYIICQLVHLNTICLLCRTCCGSLSSNLRHYWSLWYLPYPKLQLSSFM